MPQVRELLPEEFDRLTTVDGPLAGQVVSPDVARVVVIEDGDRIVGYWPIFGAVHAEPLWIDPAFRSHAHLATALILAVLDVLRQDGVQFVFGIIGEADADLNGPMAEKLGFAKIPGALYGCTVPEA